MCTCAVCAYVCLACVCASVLHVHVHVMCARVCMQEVYTCAMSVLERAHVTPVSIHLIYSLLLLMAAVVFVGESGVGKVRVN